MKKIILYLILIVSANLTLAQGNLQFNQVYYWELTSGALLTGWSVVASQTVNVPIGKVVKIESIGANGFNSSTGLASSGTLCNVLLNDKYIFRQDLGVITPPLPIWLPSGTYNLKLESLSSISSMTAKAYISAIEFNIVP